MFPKIIGHYWTFLWTSAEGMIYGFTIIPDATKAIHDQLPSHNHQRNSESDQRN